MSAGYISRQRKDTSLLKNEKTASKLKISAKYNHVSMFLCSRTKKAFKPLSQATFAIAKFQYLFRISEFSHFLFKLCQMVIFPVKGIYLYVVNIGTSDGTYKNTSDIF